MGLVRHIAVRELPASVESALKAVGFRKRDIALTTAEKVNISDGGSEGRRAFVAIVDLATGKKQVTYGSWGGPNMFNPTNSVDTDDRLYPMVPNIAIVRGSEGGTGGVYATLYVHPQSIVPNLLPAGGCEVTEREGRILAVFHTLKAGVYRVEALKRMEATPQEVEALVSRGLLRRASNMALSITTEGKNACAGVRVF